MPVNMKHPVTSDIVTNKKSGSIEPKKERVPNNTIFYIRAPPPLKAERERGEREEKVNVYIFLFTLFM